MAESTNSKHYSTLILMSFVLFAAVAFVMTAINLPMPPIYQTNPAATDHGYTWSLSFFVLPLLLLSTWTFRRRKVMVHRWEALKLSVLITVVVWSVFDIVGALSLFRFPNEGATIGFGIPGWQPGNGFNGRVPIEEFIFYIGGAMTTLMLYIWSGEEWFKHYELSGEEYAAAAKRAAPTVVLHAKTIAIGILLLVAGLAYKKLGNHAYQDGLPLYYFFMVAMVIGPTAFVFTKLKGLVNGRAMVFTWQAIFMISLGWEVTLALPYGWWAYNPDFMLGAFVPPWFGLPLEEVFLWFASGWSSVFVFELLRAYKASGQPIRYFLFATGPKPVAITESS